MTSKLSRRQFLVASGAVAALGATRVDAGAPESVDVAIVGAGLSGMNAAALLSDLGAKVVVLEAETRTGGRCLTKDAWFRTPDLGGAQIGRDYARILDACHKLGVQLGRGAHINAPYSFVVGGQLVPATKWAESPLNRLEGKERTVAPHALGGYFVEGRTPFTTADEWLSPAAREYDVSVADWLTKCGASAEARRIVQEGQGGIPLERLSVLRMMQEAGRSKLISRGMDEALLKGKDSYERAGLLSFHVVGGTSRLTDAMAAKLGDRIRLGTHVVAIDLAKTGATVRCADGSRVRAKFVIAAVPFTVLRKIAITPKLAGDQADAVTRMPYGNQSQVWLHVKDRYWEKDGIEASMWTDGPFTLIRQQIENDGDRVLMSVLAFGEKSKKVDAMPEAERARFAIAEIEKVRPSAQGAFEFVGAHSWELAPHQRGCSFQMVPGRAWDWAQNMAKPHGNLHFAGEHLRRTDVGMEAAMESGERAAVDIAEKMDA